MIINKVPEHLLEYIRRGEVIKFYKSPEWTAKREDIIKRDKECQKCKANGEVGPAECVHHIKHLKKAPELALEDDNLIALCNVCHNIEHPEKLKKNKRRFINTERW